MIHITPQMDHHAVHCLHKLAKGTVSNEIKKNRKMASGSNRDRARTLFIAIASWQREQSATTDRGMGCLPEKGQNDELERVVHTQPSPTTSRHCHKQGRR